MSGIDLWHLVAVLSFVAVAEVLRWKLGRLLRRFVVRRRTRRARRGEVSAEKLLERQGYRVVERQPSHSFEIAVDGEPMSFELRADLLVEKRGRRLIAEVKTGEQAPRIETSATRRQLLEYVIAYHREADGVLLVDATAKTVREVVFPLPSRRWARLPSLFSLLTTAIFAAFVGAGISLVLSTGW